MENIVPMPDREYDDRFQPCMLMGAVLAATAVKKSVVALHGTGGCRMTFEHLRSDNVPDGIFIRTLPSALDQSDVIHGGANKLDMVLDNAARESRGKGDLELIWLFTSCASSIIADDIIWASHRAEERNGITVIPIDVPGFWGGYVRGAQKVYAELLNKYAEEEKDKYISKRKPNIVNLIGPVFMGSKNWPWDYDEISRLLEAAGVEVNCVLTRNTSTEDVRKFARAAANIVLTTERLEDFEEKSTALDQRIFGQDLVLPYGLTNTDEWYLTVAKEFGDVEKAKNQLEKDMKRLHRRMKLDYNASWAMADINGKHCAILGYAPFVASIARFMYFDLNARPVLLGLLGETEESIQRAHGILKEMTDLADVTSFENPSYLEWGKALEESDVDFVIGQKQDRVLTEGLGLAHCSLGGFYFLNQMDFVPWPATGYLGFLRLLTEVERTVQEVKYEKDVWKKLSPLKIFGRKGDGKGEKKEGCFSKVSEF